MFITAYLDDDNPNKVVHLQLSIDGQVFNEPVDYVFNAFTSLFADDITDLAALIWDLPLKQPNVFGVYSEDSNSMSWEVEYAF